MFQRNTTVQPSDPVSPGHLGQVAVFVAAGTVIGTRAKMGGALVMAGLAWLAMRRRQKQGQKTLPKTETPVIVMPEAMDSAEFCPPSSPFMDDDPVEEMSLEDLRAALLPPPSLFTPPASKPAPELPESSLLKSAPVYVEIEEDLPSASASANINSVLPDTIVIPITQETAPDLWSNSPSSESDQNGSPASVPQGGSKAPPATPISKEPAEIPVSRPAMQPPLPAKKERGFLAWLRKP